MSSVRPPRVFRVTGAVWLLGIAAAVALFLLIDAGVHAGVGAALLLAPWALLVLWAIYVVGVASDIRADATGVQVQNLLRRTLVPWERVTRIGMRWQIEFVLDDGDVVRCFGGPSMSRPRRIGPGRTKEEGNADQDDGIARLKRLRLDAQESPEAGASGAIAREWDWPAVAALGVIVVWAAIATLLTR